MQIHCKYDKLIDFKHLNPHPKNRNQHPKEQVERLAKILKYQGIRAPIVVSKRSGFIVKGHGTLMAIKECGEKEAPVVYQDFEDDDQEYTFVQSDNAIASWAELDLAGINLDIPELGPFDIDLLGIKDFVVEPADKEGNCDADDVPDERATDIKLGDLFQLGSHRLLCGDSTSVEAVTRLLNGEKADMVFTDPPYGMNLDTDYSKLKGWGQVKKGTISTKWKPVEGDDRPFDPTILLSTIEDVKEVILWGADYYHSKLNETGTFLIWDKNNGNEKADAIIGSGYEIAWSKQRHKKEMCRIFGRGTFGHDKVKVHPTQKPVQLAEWFFERWGKEAKLVIDLYLGSGSTLIACEKTNRICYGMEIDPQYCQVIIDRWEKFTGQKAVKLGDS